MHDIEAVKPPVDVIGSIKTSLVNQLDYASSSCFNALGWASRRFSGTPSNFQIFAISYASYRV